MVTQVWHVGESKQLVLQLLFLRCHPYEECKHQNLKKHKKFPFLFISCEEIVAVMVIFPVIVFFFYTNPCINQSLVFLASNIFSDW